MIRFSGHKVDGTRIIGVGITKALFAKLVQGEVAQIDLALLGVPKTELFLVGGESELTITRDFRHLIGIHTNVEVDPAAVRKEGK